MPNIATTLTSFSENGNVKTYVAPQHSVAEPRLVIQKRKVATSVKGTAETSVKVVYGTSDTAGPIASRVSFEVIARCPVGGDMTDYDDAMSLFKEIVASDEFDAAVTAQTWVK